MTGGERPETGTAPAVSTADPCAAPSQVPGSGAPFHVTGRCAGCGACLLTCPQRAIRPSGGTLLIRADLCDGCGECVEVCPVDAIDEVTVPAGDLGPGSGAGRGSGSPHGGLR